MLKPPAEPAQAAFTALAIGLGIAGLVTSAVSQHKAANAQEAAGQALADVSESQAKLQDFNAQVADEQAQDSIQRGAEQESRLRTQIRGTIGAQRNAVAGGNVDVGFGSAVDVQGDAAYLGELDAQTIKTNAMREAWGYQVQAFDMRNQAAIDRKAATNQVAAGQAAGTAANIGAATTLLTGGSSLLQARYGFTK